MDSRSCLVDSASLLQSIQSMDSSIWILDSISKLDSRSYCVDSGFSALDSEFQNANLNDGFLTWSQGPPVKALRSKRRNSPYIFQIVASLPTLTQTVQDYK